MSIQAQGAPRDPVSFDRAEKRREFEEIRTVATAGAWSRRWLVTDAVMAMAVSAVILLPLASSGAEVGAMPLRLALLAGSYASLLLLAMKSCGIYDAPAGGQMLRQCFDVCKAVAVATLLFLAALAAAEHHPLPTRLVASTALVNAALLAGSRVGSRGLSLRRAAHGRAVRHVLIVGSGAVGQSLGDSMARQKGLGLAVRGFLDDRASDGRPLLGTLADFEQVARAEFVDDVYVTLPLHRPGVMELIEAARARHISVKIVPPLMSREGSLPVHYIGFHPAFTLHQEPVRGVARLCKRCVDVLGALLLLLLAAPVMIVVALAIKLDSRGPVLYCADRAGFKGRRFRFYKFRTMVSNADELKEELRRHNERLGPFFKMKNDPRLTRVGRFLRSSSLDELPQLFHVLSGEMSLVGPRPHPVDDYRLYSLEHLRRLDVLPGITGLWQVTARRDPSFERNMQLDLHYIEHWSLWLDLKILAMTLPAVLRREGV